jgi:ribosomal protein S18 acetylase RimI-like enzyme
MKQDRPYIFKIDFKDKETHDKYFKEVSDLVLQLDNEIAHMDPMDIGRTRDMDNGFFDEADVWVCVWQDKVIGFVEGRNAEQPKDAYAVTRLYVDGEWREMGLANKLVQTVIAHAKTCKKRFLSLMVFSKNTVAKSMWEKLGFFTWSEDMVRNLDV